MVEAGRLVGLPMSLLAVLCVLHQLLFPSKRVGKSHLATVRSHLASRAARESLTQVGLDLATVVAAGRRLLVSHTFDPFCEHATKSAGY